MPPPSPSQCPFGGVCNIKMNCLLFVRENDITLVWEWPQSHQSDKWRFKKWAPLKKSNPPPQLAHSCMRQTLCDLAPLSCGCGFIYSVSDPAVLKEQVQLFW